MQVVPEGVRVSPARCRDVEIQDGSPDGVPLQRPYVCMPSHYDHPRPRSSCKFGHKCANAHILPGQPPSMDWCVPFSRLLRPLMTQLKTAPSRATSGPSPRTQEEQEGRQSSRRHPPCRSDSALPILLRWTRQQCQRTNPHILEPRRLPRAGIVVRVLRLAVRHAHHGRAAAAPADAAVQPASASSARTRTALWPVEHVRPRSRRRRRRWRPVARGASGAGAAAR